jgi:site-specific DNA recombinase
MKAIGYIRVSTEKQADGGVSLEAQEAKIRAMAVCQGADLLEVIVDAGQSAKSLDRPGMDRLLGLVDARMVDTIIVCKLDRMTRSVKDLGVLLERLSRRGVSLVSVSESLDTGSAAGRLVLNLLMSVSQWERETIGERTADAMAHMKACGQRVGNIAFGYQLGAAGKLEANPTEQEVIARVKELRDGGYSLREIAAELNRQGFTTRRGSAWKHEYVHGILKAAA